MTPPPGAGPDSPDPNTPPSSPTAASPSPAQPAPAMQQGTQMGIQVASLLRSIAKAFPATAPTVAKMNNDLREVMAKMMTQGQVGEAQAPPTSG